VLCQFLAFRWNSVGEPFFTVGDVKHRNALIVATSVTGLLAAGSLALAANMGLLNEASSEGLGQLSAVATSTPLTTTTTAAVSTTVTSTVPTSTKLFALGEAGTLRVRLSGTTLSIEDLATNSGWTAAAPVSQARSVSVLLTDSTGRTVRFEAHIDASGAIDGHLESASDNGVATHSTKVGDGSTGTAVEGQTRAGDPRSGDAATDSDDGDDATEHQDRGGQDGDRQDPRSISPSGDIGVGIPVHSDGSHLEPEGHDDDD
jgi:hypothetical protein